MSRPSSMFVAREIKQKLLRKLREFIFCFTLYIMDSTLVYHGLHSGISVSSPEHHYCSQTRQTVPGLHLIDSLIQIKHFSLFHNFLSQPGNARPGQQLLKRILISRDRGTQLLIYKLWFVVQQRNHIVSAFIKATSFDRQNSDLMFASGILYSGFSIQYCISYILHSLF